MTVCNQPLPSKLYELLSSDVIQANSHIYNLVLEAAERLKFYEQEIDTAYTAAQIAVHSMESLHDSLTS